MKVVQQLTVSYDKTFSARVIKELRGFTGGSGKNA